jgi:2-iminoacetate synthase ThiH
VRDIATSGEDTLHVRRTYLKKRRSRHYGPRLPGALWIAVVSLACALGVVTIATFVIGQ